MRSREEVDATLQVAKVDPAELLPAAQCLSFSAQADAADCYLLQLEPELCAELEAGRSLVIRGDKEEHAVLCSKNQTYDMKIADTSNMLLFIPACETPEQLCPDTPPSVIYTQYTTDALLDQIQASEEEIMQQLEVLKACQVEGYWRILDFDYEMKLLNHVTQLIYTESWSFSKVPLSTCLQELGPLEPKEMIEHILRSYGRQTIVEGEIFYEMNEEKICRATAQMLLQNAVKFSLSEFQEVWQQSVPEGMTTRLDQLKSLALVDRSSRPETISLLNVEDLPEESQERFNSLFTIREKWTEADIAPYIQDLCSEKQTIGALLTKYARSSTQNGIKVYNSRRPIS
ncbi:sister chromatid cohesion protein DCC1 isoform X2 [Paroedura picta]|uniref:sister chromatid cohesion protein DCC1 isoform X2 n=1 Tax=Paroedura picta TaxID=143630 RepID=UPI004056D157